MAAPLPSPGAPPPAPPCPGAPSIQHRPPCASTSSRTTARPSPVPVTTESRSRSSRTNASHTRFRSAGGHARASIFHPQLDLSVARRGADRDRLPVGAIPGAIVQQVEDDLPQGVGVALHHQILGDIHPQRDPPVGHHGREVAGGPLDHRPKLDRLHSHPRRVAARPD